MAGAPYLVVAGEASGDAMAARVVSRVTGQAVGMGGPALAEAGAELVIHDLGLASMGPVGAVRRAARLRRAYAELVECARRRGTRAALLVGFSAFNARLGRKLRRSGVRVLWYAPPQVWAWRSSRVRSLAESCDRVALLFAFEAAFWNTTSVDVHYVGHPSIETEYESRQVLRQELCLRAEDVAIALLPGSRDAEVKRTLEPMLEGMRSVAAETKLQVALLLAPSLTAPVESWARQRAGLAGIRTLTGCRALPAFDVACATSGTITLECALVDVPPLIVYRTDPVTAWLAARVLETPYIGLPNAILGRLAFPELLQNQLNAVTLASQVQQLLTHRQQYLEACSSVRTLTARPGQSLPSERVAQLLEPWLS
jgi:lipid-A-disaccharide synthase